MTGVALPNAWFKKRGFEASECQFRDFHSTVKVTWHDVRQNIRTLLTYSDANCTQLYVHMIARCCHSWPSVKFTTFSRHDKLFLWWWDVMSHLADTQNCGLRMRLEFWERFFSHHRLQCKPLISDLGISATIPAFPVHTQPAILRTW